MSDTKHATDVDQAVGNAIRVLRAGLGLSQAQLAEQIGITFQQMHKYENAINRISAGRLAQIAAALQVEPGALFTTKRLRNVGSRLHLELARCFAGIAKESHREALVELARSLMEA